jgi:plasmid stability protein
MEFAHPRKEPTTMSLTTPISIDAAEDLSVAIRLRAARDGVSPEEVVHGILRKALAPEIEEASGTVPLATVIQQVMHANGKVA